MLRLSYLALLCLFVASWLSASPGAEPRFADQRLAEIPRRMEQFVRQGVISGAVTLVATQDQVVHLAAVGQADIAAGRSMETDTIFRIASMTKPITATALMMLVEEGKLQVGDPVGKYLPSYASMKTRAGSTARPVTVLDILTHTAGLAQPPRGGGEDRSLAELAEQIGSEPLAFDPGSKWQYSSGLTVAGRLIEIAAGTDYATFLQKRIFDPLGMKDTAFQLSPDQHRRLAVTYEPGKDKGSLQAVSIPDPTIRRTPNPSGGLYSTATDMARFYQAILGGGALGDTRILPARRVAEMTANHTPGIETGFTPGNAWGLGWCRVERPQGVTRHLFPGTYGHGGAWGTQGWVDPQRELILVLMIQRSGFGNSDGSDVRDAFTELAVLAHRGQESPQAHRVSYHGYEQAIELQRDDVRAVLCPQVGGRPLEFSVAGKNALFLDPEEGQPARQGALPVSAGRFDIGPELVTPSHPRLWSGEWSAEITGPSAARLTSLHDPATGVQLIRDFELDRSALESKRGTAANSADGKWRLACRQTIANVSNKVGEFGHWGRSFSPGGGICVIPLAGRSRFPGHYALYEDSAVINVRAQDEQIRERDGFLEILAPPRKPKLGFDSYAGWLAYLMPDDWLFVKRFPTYPDRVYGEAAGLTISVWYPPGPRIELEPIGLLERLEPGQTASFTEEWWLMKYPFPKAGEAIDLSRLREAVTRATSAKAS